MIVKSTFLQQEDAMDQNVYELRLNRWEKLIQKASTCGQSKKQWCVDNGVSIKQFYYWQRKVRHRAIEKSCEVPEKNLPGFATLMPPAQDPSYIETETVQAPDVRTAGTSSSIVLCCSDYRLLIGDSVSEQTLKTVLRAMKNA